MSIPSITPRPQFFTGPEIEEDEVIDLLDDLETDNDMAFFIEELTEDIHDLSLSEEERIHRTDIFLEKSHSSCTQLNTLPFLQPQAHKNTQCLKQDIASSSLSEAPAFERKKSELADCLQNTDRLRPEGIFLCIKKHTKDLPPNQKQQIINFVPKAIIGRAANDLFAPFAALSQLIKVVAKSIYIIGVSNGSLSNVDLITNPMQYTQNLKEVTDTFEGRNQGVNEIVKQNIPLWMTKAHSLLAEGDEYLKAFDQYMYDQYRTIPGLAREGIHGMVEAALPGAIKAVGVGTKLLAQGTVRAADLTLDAMAELAARQSLTPALSRVTQPIGRFARDEYGGGNISKLYHMTVQEKRLQKRTEYLSNMSAEVQRSQFLFERKPRVILPFPDTRKLLFSDYIQHPYKVDFFQGTLLLKRVDNSLLYVHRKTFGRMELISKYSQKPAMERLLIVLDELFRYSVHNRAEKVFIAWDPKYHPMITAVETKGLLIDKIGEISTLESKVFSIIEVTVPKP